MSSKFKWVACSVVMLLATQSANAQSWSESLNEAPLTPIPAQMTFEEYQDMNRRLTVGLALRAIPVPGMLHFYAGEARTGKRLLASSLLGVAAIVVGAALTDTDDGDFPSTDFDVLILNEGDRKRERRYAQVPVEIEDGTTQFKLRELHRDGDFMPGGPLMVAGALVIGFDLLYDFVHGIRVIENKRDRVRYKYGRQLGMKLQAGMDGRSPGVALSYGF